MTSHTLTVVQLAFSPNSKQLLSVSRDRRWSLFTINGDTKQFELAATTNKSTGIHSRIIWCCSWSHDSVYFATGSREGKIVVWNENPAKEANDPIGKYEPASDYVELKGDSITALCFAPDFIQDKYLLAAGLESGLIYLYKWSKDWTLITILDNRY